MQVYLSNRVSHRKIDRPGQDEVDVPIPEPNQTDEYTNQHILGRQFAALRSVNEIEESLFHPDRRDPSRIIQIIRKGLFEGASQPSRPARHVWKIHVSQKGSNDLFVESPAAESAFHLRLMQPDILVGFENLLQEERCQDRQNASVLVLAIYDGLAILVISRTQRGRLGSGVMQSRSLFVQVFERMEEVHLAAVLSARAASIRAWAESQ